LIRNRIRSWLLPVAGAVALAAGVLPQAPGAAARGGAGLPGNGSGIVPDRRIPSTVWPSGK
jgi:hypothetical protein